jgi:hypothetical protein
MKIVTESRPRQRGGSDSAATTFRGVVPTLLIQRGGSESADTEGWF